MSLAIGLAAIAAAILLMVFLFAGSRKENEAEVLREAELATVGGGPTASPARSLIGTEPEELDPLWQRLGRIAAKLTPKDYGRRLQRRLDLAGNPARWSADRVLAAKGGGLLAGLILGGLYGAKHGVGIVFFPLILGALGFFVPDILINNTGQKRQIELLKGLPDALDMLTVCVEAGLGFDAAMSRVALNLEGPMAAEFARVVQEMQFGKSRTEALRALVDRTDLSELRTFVSALVQSSELGISIGLVLREQAKEMRIRRRQRAEELAQKLPVKILLPLITCLLPAMFIVVLGPAMINIFNTLGDLNK